MGAPKKLLILYILDIFKEHTDENHKLLQKDIINILKSDYDMICDRKTIKQNIINLIDYGCDIVNDNGWYLVERDFEDSEIRVLIDSVLYSKNISKSQAEKLIDKLKKLSNKYFKARVKHIYNIKDFQHTNNEQVFYNIDIIDEAIEKNKKIAFVYNEYKTDMKLHPKRHEKYIFNPYQIISNNGRYYLLGNYDKYEDLSHYRIDRITNIELLEEIRKPMNKVKGLEHGLDIPKHMKEHAYMFSGTESFVKIKADKIIFSEIIDWFGKDIRVYEEDEKYVKFRFKSNEMAAFYWAMQYAEYVEVLEPESIRNRVKETIIKMQERY